MVTKLETLAGQDGRSDAAAPACAPLSIDVFTRLDDARAEWAELFALAPASAYQAYEFVSAWFETIGAAERQEPMIVVARGADGRPHALLPLALVRRGPLRIAVFMCGRESNFNLGLFRQDAGFDEAGVRRLLAQAAGKAGSRPDFYYLRNQPRRFDGAANPLALRCSRPSASFAYGAALPAGPKELDARLSREARKKLRKKEARLAEAGALRYEHSASGARAVEIAQALIAQKSARLDAMHVHSAFANPAMRSFLERACAASGDGALETHALSLSGRIVAAYAGLVHRGRFSAMLNSFDMDAEIARCSPGDLLLHALLRDLTARGFAHFDLGAGEARYKNSVCDETIELCEVIVPVTLKGALAAPLFAAFLRAKREIKQTPWMTRALVAARRWKRGARRRMKETAA